MTIRRNLSTALGLALLLNTTLGNNASAAATDLPAAPAWGHFVDTYKNNTSANSTAAANPAIGILSPFLELWTPGSSWDNGTKLNSSVLDANIQKVVDIAATRTAAEADRAYFDDRRKQSYGVIDGLGSLTDVYRTNAGATTMINDIPADATTKKYEDGGTDAGDPNSNFGKIVTLVKTLRGNYSSTSSAKSFYNYMRPFRWAGTSIIVPALVPVISTTPATDGGFPSGHTNASYLSAFAMAYAVPERFQELLTRASEMGNSRIVAGMHSPMDVMGGRIMATALAAAILNDPDNAAVKQAAYEEAHAKLLTQTGTAEDRFTDYAKNKAQYTERLTYGFSPINATTSPMVVPKGAEVLLETRLPYLDAAQRRAVLATTGLPSGYPLLDDPEGWGRLNLFAAADGYGAFDSDVTVTMDAAQGGFQARDRWRNDISGIGKLTKAGSGTLALTGSNTYAGGTQIVRGTIEGETSTAFGTGDVAVQDGTLVEQVAGKMTLGGNYAQAAGGTLELNVGSANDLLEIKGALHANGTLRLKFTDAYLPGNGAIAIITHSQDQRTGQFASVETAGLPSAYKVNVIYQADRILLEVSDGAAPSIPTPTPTPTPTPRVETKPTAEPIPSVGDQHKQTIAVTATAGPDGRAAVELQDVQLSDWLAKLDASAGGGMAAEIKVEANGQADTAALTLSSDAIGKLSASKAKEVHIVTPFGSLTLDKTALAYLSRTSGDKLLIELAAVDTAAIASAEGKRLIGTRPGLNISIQSGGKNLTSLGGGSIVTRIPYTPGQGEDNQALVASHIDQQGRLRLLPRSSYNEREGQLYLLTDQLGTYAVSYNSVGFGDTSSHWASSYTAYLAARGIVTGSGSGMFAPNADITRAEFVKMLAAFAGADVSHYESQAFADVEAADWHMPYIAWASEQQIAKGGANKHFRPNDRISREEMSVMLLRLADLAGYTLPSVAGTASFADQHRISAWAADAVSTLYAAGIISGKGNQQFDPQGDATRAEAAKLLTLLLQGMMK